MKKIVFLSMKFFGYENTICQCISNLGYDCELIYSEPKYTFFDSLIKKFDKERFLKVTDNYIKEKITTINRCDYLIVNFSPNLSPSSIGLFKEKFPNIKIIYYIWDSADNFPNVVNIAKRCDKVYSFDRKDCREYGYSFLPLFYTPVEENNSTKEYDYSMIFSIYPQKIDNYKALCSVIPSHRIGFRHIFVQKSKYYYYNVISEKFRTLSKKDVCFTPLPREKVYEVFKASKVTIDCPLTNQRGLTMRTFEALSLGIKIVTTNKDIVNYDFYNPNNIFIVEDTNSQISEDFFDTPFDNSFSMEEYSITQFVLKLLAEVKND